MARPEPLETVVRIGVGMSASDTAIQLANLANWLRGSGAQIVASSCTGYTVASGTTRIFRYRVKPRSSAIQRIWVFTMLTAGTVVVTATVKSPATTGTAQAFRVPAARGGRVPFIYTQDLAAKTSTEAEVNFEIVAAGADIIVEGVACYEQTRAALNKDSTDLGVDVETVRPGQPIRGTNYESIEGIHDLVTTADARRVAIFNWAVPEEGAVTRTTASYQTLFDLAVPVLAPLLTNGATTGTVYWSAYAKVAAGAGGQVKITTDGSAVSDPVTVSGTSFAWTTARAISIDCDDMTAADGRRSTRFDGLQVEYQGDGTNLLSLAGVSVWVADVT